MGRRAGCMCRWSRGGSWWKEGREGGREGREGWNAGFGRCFAGRCRRRRGEKDQKEER